MKEQIKQRLKWLKEDDTLIVRDIQDSVMLCKLLRINAHLQFIYQCLEKLSNE